MGGLFGGGSEPMAAPLAPVQSNAGQFAMMGNQGQQQDLMMMQMQQTQEMDAKAAEAAAEQLREITLREADAAKEKTERDKRMKKGKRDLLYGTALGIEEDDEENDMLLLGA